MAKTMKISVIMEITNKKQQLLIEYLVKNEIKCEIFHQANITTQIYKPFKLNKLFEKNSNFTTTKCQVCHIEDVVVEKNTPYFGIICNKCTERSRKSWTKLNKPDEEKTVEELEEQH